MRNKLTELVHNDDLGFLYKKSSFRPIIITKIALVPEFMEAIKSCKRTLTDEVIYGVLRETYLEMIFTGKKTAKATDIMNCISKDLFGSSSSWRKSTPSGGESLTEVKILRNNGTYAHFWLTKAELDKLQTQSESAQNAPEIL